MYIYIEHVYIKVRRHGVRPTGLSGSHRNIFPIYYGYGLPNRINKCHLEKTLHYYKKSVTRALKVHLNLPTNVTARKKLQLNLRQPGKNEPSFSVRSYESS